MENTEKIDLDGGIGCRFEGHFKVNRVPGNFHVSTHSADRQPAVIDMAHVIHSLTFGDDVSDLRLTGGFDSLAGNDKTSAQGKLMPIRCQAIMSHPSDLQPLNLMSTT